MLDSNLNKRPIIRYEYQNVNITMVVDERCRPWEIEIVGGEKEDRQAVTEALADMGWQIVYQQGDDLGSEIFANKTLLMHSIIRPLELSSQVWQELTAALKLSYT